MKIGICTEAPGSWSSGDFLRRSAQAAERAGFASMWFGDHVLLFGSYESVYPYAGVASWGQNLAPEGNSAPHFLHRLGPGAAGEGTVVGIFVASSGQNLAPSGTDFLHLGHIGPAATATGGSSPGFGA